MHVKNYKRKQQQHQNKQKSWENVFQNCTYDHTTCKCAGKIGK